MLDLEVGLVGDTWPPVAAGDAGWLGQPRCAADADELTCCGGDHGGPRPLAARGDQLFVDLDLSLENLPAGTQLAVGEAVVEVTPEPHTGCAKFSARFGTEALKFVNKSPGRELRLRGVNARVVSPGAVRAGDTVASSTEFPNPMSPPPTTRRARRRAVSRRSAAGSRP